MSLDESIRSAIESYAPRTTELAVNAIVTRVLSEVSVAPIELVDPVDLSMASNGYGQYPDGYTLTAQGVIKITNAVKEGSI